MGCYLGPIQAKKGEVMPRVYFIRGIYGLAISASWERSKVESQGRKSCYVENYKELVATLLSPYGINDLFKAAWDLAVREGAINSRQRLPRDPSHFELENAFADSEIIDGYIHKLVDDPSSLFYICG